DVERLTAERLPHRFLVAVVGDDLLRTRGEKLPALPPIQQGELDAALDRETGHRRADQTSTPDEQSLHSSRIPKTDAVAKRPPGPREAAGRACIDGPGGHGYAPVMEQEHPREHPVGDYRDRENVTEYRDRVDTIREVFSYLKQFRGTTFVVRIENAVLEDPLFSVIVNDLALMHEAGIRVALVPSAKERIDEVLRRYEVPYSVMKGVRITSEEAIPFIKMAAFDVSNRVMTMLSANGMTAVIGNWVRARGIGV